MRVYIKTNIEPKLNIATNQTARHANNSNKACIVPTNLVALYPLKIVYNFRGVKERSSMINFELKHDVLFHRILFCFSYRYKNLLRPPIL